MRPIVNEGLFCNSLHFFFSQKNTNLLKLAMTREWKRPRDFSRPPSSAAIKAHALMSTHYSKTVIWVKSASFDVVFLSYKILSFHFFLSSCVTMSLLFFFCFFVFFVRNVLFFHSPSTTLQYTGRCKNRQRVFKKLLRLTKNHPVRNPNRLDQQLEQIKSSGRLNYTSYKAVH